MPSHESIDDRSITPPHGDPLFESTEHPCGRCHFENDQWPNGWCSRCEAIKKREDAAYERALTHSNNLSWLASKLR